MKAVENRADHIYYNQCLLRHTDAQQIAWIPESLEAVRGSRVCVGGRAGWVVVTIWQRGTMARLQAEGALLRDDITVEAGRATRPERQAVP